jgi:hypothetical protein
MTPRPGDEDYDPLADEIIGVEPMMEGLPPDRDVVGSAEFLSASGAITHDPVVPAERQAVDSEEPRTEDVFARFQEIEGSRVQDVDTAQGRGIATGAESLANDLGVNLNTPDSDGGPGAATHGAGTGEPSEALTREQAEQLLRRHSMVDDAVLKSMPDMSVVAWAKRVRPAWREAQETFRRKTELEQAIAKPAPVASEPQQAEASANAEQPSAGNLEELRPKLTEELGDVGGLLIDELANLRAENAAFRTQVRGVVNHQEKAELSSGLDAMKAQYPTLSDPAVRQAVIDRARAQVQTGLYSDYAHLLRDSAMLAIGPPTPATAPPKGEDPRDVGAPSELRSRPHPGGPVTDKPDDMAFSAFQQAEAAKTRGAVLGA